MPRNVDPTTVRIGPGLSGPESADIGLSGAPIGHVGPDIPPSFDPGSAALAAIKAHIRDVHNAHPAVAISVEDATPKQFISDNVEGVVNELFSAALPPPPSLGLFARYTTFNGIPDWGYAKLGECSIRFRDFTFTPVGGSANTNDAGEVYPYFLVPPSPTTDPAFSDSNLLWPLVGSDPSTDPYFNCWTTWGGMPFATAGGQTSGTNVVMTRGMSGGTSWFPITVSGTLFPADRGVLAILHIPHQGNATAFLSQHLLKRCIAALLLGQGLEGDACIDPNNPTGGACDGGPGGIFDVGHNPTDNSYNPFVYPGRASGQYDLDELHTGMSSIDGTTPLNPPWDVPRKKEPDGRFGAWGQVRLGSNPDLNPTSDPLLYTQWGIPILGATSNAYDETTGPTLDIVPSGPLAGSKYIGDSLVLDSNFFRFRLPCLGDYSAETGLKYTPRGIDPKSTLETYRYFYPGVSPQDYEIPDPNQPYTWTATPWNMNQAGNYDNFDEDYWTWQIARYRHTFYALGDASISDPVPDEAFLGTYWLVHFKSERDFENFVLHATIPSEVYGANVIGAGINTTATVVNEQTSTSQWAPFGPAPDYGYSANSYHATQREMSLSGTDSSQQITASNFVTNEFGYAQPNIFTMDVSGVAYFVPLNLTGDPAFIFDLIDIDVQPLASTGPWTGQYRTDDLPLTGFPNTPPAVLSTPCPIFLSLAPFSFGEESGVPTFTVDTPSDLLSDLGKRRRGRIEIGFTKAGTHAGNPFSMTNAPDPTDHLVVSMSGGTPHTITLDGDLTNPAFSVDATLRAFLRRPRAHMSWQTCAMPEWASGPTIDGHGQRLNADTGKLILFHSTRFIAPGTGKFGNFVDGMGVPFSCLVSQDKDTEERFLDETYRYRVDWSTGAVDPAVAAHLNGPGMNGWSGGPIPVSVRPAETTDPDWQSVAWIWQGDYAHTLLGTDPGYAHLASELQVAGLPERNPPLSDWAKYPFPSAGLLKYPNVDYSALYVPDIADLGHDQPDYTGCTGNRGYVRAFDVAFSRPGNLPAVDAAGQPFVVLQIEGLELEDFRYTPGPLTGIRISIKVPGLTTWMDIGRPDGAGPSKQDPMLDGAGCQVIGPYTFNTVNTDTGMVRCQVQVNVGPAINLAKSGVDDEVPILVKVEMPQFSTGQWDLTSTYAGGTFGPPTGPGLSGRDIRGLVGIKIVHPTLVQTAPVP